MTEVRLTPTQDLIMEVLSARDRLGDRWWPFPARHRKNLQALAELNLVKTMHGIVENTIRVLITEEGQKLYQVPPYGERLTPEAPLMPDERKLATSIHRANTYHFDVCDHGTYAGGPNHGEPYAACELVASRLIAAWGYFFPAT
jgi:hypothetical protein